MPCSLKNALVSWMTWVSAWAWRTAASEEVGSRRSALETPRRSATDDITASAWFFFSGRSGWRWRGDYIYIHVHRVPIELSRRGTRLPPQLTLFLERQLRQRVFVKPIFALRGGSENVQEAPLEDFAVKVLVGFDGVHGVLVVDVGEAFTGVGFAIDGEVHLRVGMSVMRRMGIRK